MTQTNLYCATGLIFPKSYFSSYLVCSQRHDGSDSMQVLIFPPSLNTRSSISTSYLPYHVLNFLFPSCLQPICDSVFWWKGTFPLLLSKYDTISEGSFTGRNLSHFSTHHLIFALSCFSGMFPSLKVSHFLTTQEVVVKRDDDSIPPYPLNAQVLQKFPFPPQLCS